MDIVGTLETSIEEMVESFVANLPRLAAALIVLLLFFLLARLIQRMVARWTKGYGSSLQRLFSQMAQLFVFFLGVMLALGFFGYTIGGVFASLGVAGVIIGFAFQNLLQNFVAGIFLLLRQPFVEGDHIRQGDDEGVVKEINFRSTVLVTKEGSHLYIPNATLFTQTVENLSPRDRQEQRGPGAEGQHAMSDTVREAATYLQEQTQKDPT